MKKIFDRTTIAKKCLKKKKNSAGRAATQGSAGEHEVVFVFAVLMER